MPKVARSWPIVMLAVLMLLDVSAKAKQRGFKVRGEIMPRMRMFVFLNAHDGTFADRTISSWKGRFKFKGLKSGSYTVTLLHPYWGETRRTIEITSSFADEEGRVDIRVPFILSENGRKRMLRKRTLVSAKQLRIPSQAWKELRKARRWLSKNDSEAAVAHLKKAVESAPQFVVAWNFLGKIAYREKQFGKAEEYFRRALREDPEAYAPTVNLGGTLLVLGRYSEALPYNTAALEMRPDDALACAQTGVNYFFRREYAKAERYLQRAKQLDPSHFTNPQLVLAQVYETQGKPSEAITELREFLARHPDSSSVEKVELAIRELKDKLRDQQSSSQTDTGVSTEPLVP